MAISFDTTGSGSGALNTATMSIAAAAANEMAFIYAVWDATLGGDFLSLTVNGSTTGVTQIEATQTTPDGAQKMAMFYVYNPPTSAVDYTIITTGVGDGTNIVGSLYSGTDSTIDSSDTGTTTTGSGDTLVLSTTVVAANCWLVSGVGQRGGSADFTPNAGTGTTIRVEQTGRALGDSNAAVGTGSQSMEWTPQGAGSLTGIIASFGLPVNRRSFTLLGVGK